MHDKNYLLFLEEYSKKEGPQFLYYLCKPDSTILAIFPNTNFSTIARELDAAGRLDLFFEWPDADEIRSGGATGGICIKNFDYFRKYQGFHTSLPLFATRFECLDNDTLLGRISLHYIIPNVATDLHIHYIYIDQEKEIIKGFNHQFFQLIKERFQSVSEVIDMPINRFFSSFPLQHLENSAPIVPAERTVVINNTGERLWNAGPNAALMPLLSPADTWNEGLTVEIEVNPINNVLPVVYLCAQPPDNPEEPDDDGYMVGLHASEELWIIKRRGYVMTAVRAEPLSAILRITVTIRAGAFFLDINGRNVIAYKDISFLASEKASLCLGLRAETATRLRSVRVSRFSSSFVLPSPKEREVLLPLKEKQLAFNLERFYNDGLTSSPLYFNCAAYYLYNVTEMREQMSELDSRFKSQSRKMRQLEEQVTRFEPLVREQPLIGSGVRIKAVREWADRMAQSDATVLIEGPTGSGKEVLARHIHEKSSRRKGPFVKVDCATIPQTLIESQLFGYEKGAFTGAEGRFTGLIERANQGTLFLDEVSNLNLSTQAKLLQFLNDFAITRLGGTAPVRINVRFVAASNRKLLDMIRDAVFREDLYYRLSVFQLTLPSLNDRREDIPELTRHFLEYFNLLYTKKIESVSPDLMERLLHHNWRGNIREFRNIMERAVLFAPSDVLTPDLVKFDSEESPEQTLDRSRRKAVSAERMVKTSPDYVRSLLRKHKGRVAAAVREMGTSPGAFYYFLRMNKIMLEDFREGYGNAR